MVKTVMENLLKWTPASVIALIVVTVCAATTLWYAFHFETPPSWVFTTFAIFGGGSLMGVGATVGASSTQAGLDKGKEVINAVNDGTQTQNKSS